LFEHRDLLSLKAVLARRVSPSNYQNILPKLLFCSEAAVSASVESWASTYDSTAVLIIAPNAHPEQTLLPLSGAVLIRAESPVRPDSPHGIADEILKARDCESGWGKGKGKGEASNHKALSHNHA
jgi:hypothetical protein